MELPGLSRIPPTFVVKCSCVTGYMFPAALLPMEFTKRKNPGIYDGFEDKAVWAGIRIQAADGLLYDIDLTTKAAFLRPEAEQGELQQFHVDTVHYKEVPGYLTEVLGPEVYQEEEETEGNPSEVGENPVFEEPVAQFTFADEETKEPVMSVVPSSVLPGEEELTEDEADDGGEEVVGFEGVASENPEGSDGSDEVREVEPENHGFKPIVIMKISRSRK